MPTAYLWVMAAFLLMVVIAAFLRLEERDDAPPSVRTILYLLFLGKLALFEWTVVLIVTWEEPLARMVLL